MTKIKLVPDIQLKPVTLSLREKKALKTEDKTSEYLRQLAKPAGS
jgi:hypothetical protein